MASEQTQVPASSAQSPSPPPQTGLEADAVRALGRRTPQTPAGDDSREGAGLIREPAKEAMDFAMHVHEYHSGYIALADQKAAFVFAASSAFLVYLYQKGAHVRWLKPPSGWSAVDFLAFLGMTGLVIGLVAAAAVVAPRFKRTHRGFVYFESIAEFETAADYAATVARESGESLTMALLKHTYDLAQVARRKFRALVFAIWGSAVGYAISLAALFL